jgi:hypothetical protein
VHAAFVQKTGLLQGKTVLQMDLQALQIVGQEQCEEAGGVFAQLALAKTEDLMESR